MAYVIEYGGQVPGRHLHTGKKRYGWLLAVGVLVFVGVIHWFFPEVTDKVQQLLIPGEDAVTVHAFENMVDMLRSGGDLRECVTVFCREVIYGAS